jgi:uncharacterized protein involved in outer membrane biogenesis
MSKTHKIIIWIASGLVGAVVALLLFIWLFPPNLDFLRSPVEGALSKALGAQVSFRGPMRLEPSLLPTATAKDVRMVLGNKGQAGDLIKVEYLRVRLAWLALLQGEFLFERIAARNLDIYLEPSAKPGQGKVLRLKNLSCRLEVLDDGVELHGLTVETGDSRLRGSLSWRGSDQAPLVKAEAVFSTLQVDDFLPPIRSRGAAAAKKRAAAIKDKTGKAKPTEPKPARPGEEAGNAATSLEVVGLQDSIEAVLRHLLSYQRLELAVKADKIIAGKDQAGSGNMLLQVKGGVLTIAPARIELPTGSLDFKLRGQKIGQQLDLSLRLQASKVDLGLLTRRLDATSDLAGAIGMDLALRARAPNLHKFMARASGHFDFAAAPKNLRTAAFSGWGTNLVLSILPKLDKDQPAKLNCLVSSFNIKNGRTDGEVIFMDTTHLTVVGKGKIDFRNRELDLILSPFPKNPELFSMETPVTASGKFDNIDIGVSVGALIASGFGMLASPIFAPLRRIATLVEPGTISACQGAIEKVLEKRKIDPSRATGQNQPKQRRPKGENK